MSESQELINPNTNMRQIADKYQISEETLDKLKVLQDFSIIYIFDDSGSMNTPLEDSPLNIRGSETKVRRWDELQFYSNISIEVLSLFNSTGCDVYFLNRGIVRNVRNSSDLILYFQNPPKGHTPLRYTFNAVLKDYYETAKERKLLVIIITDGEPTDENGIQSEIKEFKKCLKYRKFIDNIYVTIVACTDDDNSISYLDEWDNEIKNLDVIDDFRSERDQIIKARGYSFKFTFGDYVAKSLLGSIDPELDELDEPAKVNDIKSKWCCAIS